jgi:glycine/D-amino acid oxidase-like deaminating enzyme
MASRARQLWGEHEQRWQRRFLHRTGVLWMAAGDDAFERGSFSELRAAGMKYEELALPELQKRWPQINFEDVRWGIYEPGSGYLTARVACQAVVEGFIAEGGEYREAAVSADGIERGDSLALSDGSKLMAEQYVFACGPWLGKMFPQVIGDKIRPTKQDVFFFGTPPGDVRFDDTHLPVWADHREHFVYGIPGNQGRGFKIADDTRGADFDPTSGDRVVSSEVSRRVRDYLAFRFPAMRDAPLLETRVCQYENSPDEGFIIDRHPAVGNVWLVGGGSGHGFKHGPALGEMVAGLVMEQGDPPALFRLARFGRNSHAGATQGPSASPD